MNHPSVLVPRAGGIVTVDASRIWFRERTLQDWINDKVIKQAGNEE